MDWWVHLVSLVVIHQLSFSLIHRQSKHSVIINHRWRISLLQSRSLPEAQTRLDQNRFWVKRERTHPNMKEREECFPIIDWWSKFQCSDHPKEVKTSSMESIIFNYNHSIVVRNQKIMVIGTNLWDKEQPKRRKKKLKVKSIQVSFHLEEAIKEQVQVDSR